MGSHNLALSTWLSRSGQDSRLPDVRAVSTEVMVWTDSTPGATPPGRFVQELQVGGERYELWRAVAHGKAYKREGWTVLTLRAGDARSAGHVALGALVLELAGRGYCEVDQYLTCVELGNEVMGGAGTTFVQQFVAHL